MRNSFHRSRITTTGFEVEQKFYRPSANFSNLHQSGAFLGWEFKMSLESEAPAHAWDAVIQLENKESFRIKDVL